jgi:hypothetical protein
VPVISVPVCVTDSRCNLSTRRLMAALGCARHFSERHRRVRVVAVDSVGLVAFGGAPGRRMVPRRR